MPPLHHDLAGILERVEILARDPLGHARVSRLIINSGTFKTEVPYFGHLDQNEINHLRFSPVTLKEERRGPFWDREIHQELEGAGLWRATAIPQWYARDLLREHYR